MNITDIFHFMLIRLEEEEEKKHISGLKGNIDEYRPICANRLNSL